MIRGIHSTRQKPARLLALSLALLGNAWLAAGHAAEGPKGAVYDSYFSDVYTQLRNTDHVYESLTYHQLRYLLTTPGNYVVLFGGAWSPHTQAVIGYINEVAREYGISAIYQFDPRLDGANAVTDISDPANESAAYRSRYVELVQQNLRNYQPVGPGAQVSYSYAQNGEQITVSAPRIPAPYLFVYNKDNADGNAPIVADLQALLAYGDFLTGGTLDPAKVDAYKNQVRAVFDRVAVQVDGRRVVQNAVLNNDDYFRVSYNNATNRTIFEEGESIVFHPVTYHELQQILQSEGDYVFLFGGAWCPNTQPIINLVNAWAKEQGITTVYTWDTRLDGGFDPRTGGTSDALHTRQVDRPNAYVYVDLVNQYFPNLVTQNVLNPNGNPRNPPATPSGGQLIWYTNSAGEQVFAGRLQVPYVFTYNKDNRNAAGAAEPIFGHVELMYTATNIVEGHASGNRARYFQALNLLGSRLEAVPTGLTAVAPSAANRQDGRITGIAGAVEYKAASATEYTPVTGDTIDGLAPGTYQVRYVARTGYVAGATEPTDLYYYGAGQPVNVVVPAVPAVPVAQATGGGFPAALAGLVAAAPAATEPHGDEEEVICGDTEEVLYF